MVERGPAQAVTARLLVAPGTLAPGDRTVDGEDYVYLFRARRLAVGDPVVLFDGAGREADAAVASVDDERAVLAVGPVRQATRPGPHITVIQAVVKGERMDWCLEKLVEVGADAIVPVETARTVVRLDAAKRAGRRERHRALAEAAARQCGRADLPAIAEVAPLAAALAAVDAEVRVVAQPGAPALRVAPAASLAILVGPEGGLAPEEVALAERHGFTPVSLGPTILRAETAGLILVAAYRLFAPGPGTTV